MKPIHVAALTFLLSLFISVNAHAWVTEVVDWPKLVPEGGVGSSIGVDSAGAVHVSSVDDASDHLMYSTNTSGSWETIIVDTFAEYTSIALDSSDKVHISYQSHYPDGLKYATNASGAWLTTTVDPDGRV
jgi:hypothetical protein